MKTKCHCKRMVARSLLSENLSTQPAALAGSTRIFIWGGVHLVQFEPKFFHALGFTGVVAPTEWLNVENTPTLLHLIFKCFFKFKFALWMPTQACNLENANKANSLSQIPNMLKTPKPSSIQHCLALKELNQGRQILPQREAKWIESALSQEHFLFWSNVEIPHLIMFW